jgi:tripartite motif-containing protein 71
VNKSKRILAKLPFSVWFIAYGFVLLSAISVLAYVGTFSSADTPVVATQDTQGVTDKTAIIKGVVSNPKDFSAGGFQYGPDTNYGATVYDQGAVSYRQDLEFGAIGTGDGQFGQAYGLPIATDSTGSFYVADTSNNRIQKFDSEGTFVLTFGVTGSGDGEFSAPSSITTDSSGDLYVADTGNNRIQKFDSSGNFLMTFGSQGTGNGQFMSMGAVRVASDGSIFVHDVSADDEIGRIQKFNSSGVYQTKLSDFVILQAASFDLDASNNVYIKAENLLYVYDVNLSYVSDTDNPHLLTVYSVSIFDNKLYGVDPYTNRVFRFNLDGTFIDVDNVPQGEESGELFYPFTFDVDTQGRILMSDFNSKIIRFGKGLTAQITNLSCGTTYHYRAFATSNSSTEFGEDKTITTSSDCGSTTEDATNITSSGASVSGLTYGAGITERGFEYGTSQSLGQSVVDSSGANLRQSLEIADLDSPTSVQTDYLGNIYIVDNQDIQENGQYIQKFDSNGNFITKFGSYLWNSLGIQDGSFDEVSDMAVGQGTNSVYVLDPENCRIQKFDSNGNFITKWGSQGTGDGQFGKSGPDPLGPRSLAVDNDGNVFVADYNNHRIQKFDSNGNFITKWGTEGTGDGQFTVTAQVETDSLGNVYVWDGSSNDRIQKFDNDGNHIANFSNGGRFQVNSSDNILIESGSNFSVYDGSTGSLIDTVSNDGVASWGATNGFHIDAQDNIYSSRYYNPAFDPGSGAIRKMQTVIEYDLTDLDCETTYYYRSYSESSSETNTGQIKTFTTDECPPAPSVTTSQASDVTDTAATLNGITSPAGVIERGFQYGTDTNYGQSVQDYTALEYWYHSQFGVGPSDSDGQTNIPTGIDIDSDGNFYIADSANARIQKFDSSGNFITKWGTYGSENDQFIRPYAVAIDSSSNVYVVDSVPGFIKKFDSSGNFITKWGTEGTGDGEFDSPTNIAIDSSDGVFIADSGNNRIQKFDSSGNFITKWGTAGTADGELNNPNGIAIDVDNNVYITDTGNNRIQKFDSSGNFITKWGTAGTADGELQLSKDFGNDRPAGIAIDSESNVYVTDVANSRIQQFDSSGNFITKWGELFIVGESSGDANGKFYEPRGITTDTLGNVFVADTQNNRIQKFGYRISANINGLSCGTNYHYRAYSDDDDARGYGGDQTFITSDCTGPLAAPQNLMGTPSVRSVDLTWDSVSGADYYLVEYRKSSDTDWTQHNGSTVENPNLLVNGLETETEYEFRVRSANWTSGQQSDWSDIFTTTTLVPQTYYISDCAELQGIAVNPYTFEIGDVTGNYILENDIDCSESANWYWEGLVPPEIPGPLGFVAITDLFNDLPFTGNFDGQGYTISNIYQDSRYIVQTGLFGTVEGSKIENVTIESSTVKGNLTGAGEIAAAGLVGYGRNAEIVGVNMVDISLTGPPVQTYGVMAGALELSSVVDSSASGEIVADPSQVASAEDYVAAGGIVGLITGQDYEDVVLSKSYSDVAINITANENTESILIGGLAGGLFGSAQDMYATGQISINGNGQNIYLTNVGGFASQVFGSLRNAYSATSILNNSDPIGLNLTGGLVAGFAGGSNGTQIDNFLTNTFAMGLVQSSGLGGSVMTGGLLGAVLSSPGLQPGTQIQNNYYDKDSTNQDNCIGGYTDGELGTVDPPIIVECSPVNVDGNDGMYFINNSVNAPLDQWDFDAIWKTNTTTPPTFGIGEEPVLTVPGPPRSLAIYSVTGSSASLSWQAPSSTGNSPVTDYIIQYKLSSSGTWQTFNDGVSTSLNASVPGLSQASSYDFRVAAVNTIGQGPFTDPLSGSTLGPPSAPQNLVGEVVGATSVNLEWDVPTSDGGSSVTDYIIQYKLSSSGTWQTFNDGTSTNLSVSVSGLSTDQLHDFRVAAVNAIGQGPYTTINDILVESLLPGPPRNLTAANSDGVSASLQWQEPLSGNPFADYIIQYKLSSSGTWQTFNDGTSTNLSATVNSLTNGETYDFRVAATNEYGQGEWSNVATLQMLIMLSDCEELQLELSSSLGSHYGLANDIDCSDTINWNGGEGWDPVGVNGAEQPFTGTLEGYGNSITGLYINNSVESSVGMFSVLSGATIKNLVLTGGSTTASLDSPSSFGSTVGAIAGGIYESAIIQNVTTDTTVLNNGSGYIDSTSGGLVGYILYDTNKSQAIVISGSSSTGNVSGGTVVGGLVGSAVVDGLNNNSPVEDIPTDTLISITNSSSTGNITGTTASAGIIGATYGASITIQDSHATGTIITENPNGGAGSAGGIIALAPPVTARVEMDGVYATGDVLLGDGFQTAQAGGLAGTIVAGAKFYDGVPSETLGNFGLIIRDSYATGSIYNDTGSTNSIGGLVSVSQVTQIENSYYNGSLSGQTVGGTSNGNIVVGGLIAQSGITKVSDSYTNVDIVTAIDVPRKFSVEGGLVGFSLWADVRRSYANGSIQSFQLSQCEDEDCYNSASHVGGLIGAISGAASLSDPASEDSVVEDSNASVAISIDGSRSQSEGGNGGLIGSLSSMNDSNTRILGSSATGNVITDTSGPQSSSGGLVGTILSRNQPRVQISRSHATGNVVMSTVAEQNSLKPVVPFFITASGGLIGLFWGEGSVDQSYATGNSTGPRAGGLIGYAYAAGPILDSDDVSADDNIDLAITNSYATGNAQSQQQVYDIDGTDVFYSDSSGGLVGVFVGSRIENSYASGSVQANTQNSPGFTGIPTIDVLYQYGHAGGLVGILSGAVSGSFANGSVSSPSPSTRGGLVGVLSLYSDNINVVTSLQNSYFDKTRSGGQACANSFNIVGDPSNPESVNLNPYALGCIGVNENSSQPTYFFNTICNPPLNSWDFNTVWRVQKNSGPRFVSDPSASPSGCGSAPSTPTTPTTPINPTSPTNPPSSTDDDQGSIPPNTGGGAGSGRQRPSSGSRALAPVSQPILGAVIGPIIRFAETIPSPIARAIPWTILLLLIAIASFYGYSSYQEQQRRKKLIMITNRFKASLAARAAYLQITSHYIKTPITKMQGVIELLASGVISAGSSSSSGTQANLSVSATTLTIPESTIVAAKSGIESLSKHADELLTEGYSLTGQQQAYIREFGKHRILGVLSHPAFWLPAVVVLTLAILANVLFIHVDKYDATFINLTSQILLALVGILALGVSYYFLRQSKEQQNMAQIQLKIEEDISNRQQQLIAAASAKLSDDVELLSSLQNDIAKYPKTASYAAGLSELRKVVNQFTKLEQLSHSVPGLTWKTDVNAVLQRAISDNRELADERGVSVSADVESSVLVNIEEQAFTHLVSAPLKNAIQASSAGTQVSIVSQVDRKTNTLRVIISDHGSGIANDKLQTIFEPFNSATSTERFDNTGLGLDLYLAKTVSSQYGADISLSSDIQLGTRATITVMIADE